MLLHGFGGSARSWDAVRASPGGEPYPALALDLRGHGGSSHTPDGHTMATYASDVHAFLKAKDLRDAVLVGWSMGCMVVWDYFKQFGDKNIAATILVEQTPADFKWPAGSMDCSICPLSFT